MDSVDKLRGDDASLGDLERRLSAITGCGFIGDALNVIADEIEREIAERYMPLPVDADGVPVRIGDVMERTAQLGESRKVNVLKLDEYGAWWYGTNAAYMYAVEGSVHYKQRTLEDVLNDFGEMMCNSDHQWGFDAADVVPQLAAEIRELLGGAE